MKEHPIDQLFRDKLQEHQLTPSPRAWDLLEEKLEQQKKRRILWWGSSVVGIAASVSLLIYLGLGPDLPNSSSPAAGLSPVTSQVASAGTGHSTTAADQSHKGNTKQQATETGANRQLAQTIKPLVKQRSASAGESSQTKEQQQLNNLPVTEHIANNLKQELPQTNEPEKQALNTMPDSASPQVAEEEITVIVMLSEDEQEAVADDDNEQKKTRVGRFFSKLKSLKEGEITLADMGISRQHLINYLNKKSE